MDNVCLACVAWVVKMSQTFRNGSSLVILPLEMIEIWSFASSMSDPKWPRTMPCHFKCAWAIVYVCPACFPDLKIVLSSGGFMISQLFKYTTRLALILLLRLLCLLWFSAYTIFFPLTKSIRQVEDVSSSEQLLIWVYLILGPIFVKMRFHGYTSSELMAPAAYSLRNWYWSLPCPTYYILTMALYIYELYWPSSLLCHPQNDWGIYDEKFNPSFGTMPQPAYNDICLASLSFCAYQILLFCMNQNQGPSNPCLSFTMEKKSTYNVGDESL